MVVRTLKPYLLKSNLLKLFRLTGSGDAKTSAHSCSYTVTPMCALMLRAGGDIKTLFMHAHPLGLLEGCWGG